MRKIHRTFGLLFGPFLITSAVTGLLWAYAPYLYMKQTAGAPKPSVIAASDEALVRLSPVDALHKAQESVENGKAASVTLRSEKNKMVYAVFFGSRNDSKEVLIDAENGALLGMTEKKVPVFHQWVMKIHRLEFFGTKKELVAFPGVGLLLMIVTGLFLLKRSK